MRDAYWADFVPLGYFATWAGEPNPPIADTRELLARSAAVIALIRQSVHECAEPSITPLTDSSHDKLSN